MIGDFTFGDDNRFDVAESRVDEWLSGVEERAAKARVLSERVAGLTASATSKDGLITVRLSSSGVLKDLRLDDGVRRHSGDWIGERILATTRAALERLAGQIDGAVAETVGRDSPEGRAILASFRAHLAEGTDGG